jgi:hypothetical protein
MRKSAALFAIVALVLFAEPVTAQQRSGDPAATDAFDTLLKSYVNGAGLVDYHGIKKDPTAIAALAAMRKSTVSSGAPENVKIAHAINAYNATVIEQVLAHREAIRGAKNGVLKIEGFFDKTTYDIAGTSTTLNAYEARFRAMGKPEVHFGFNCGSIGCPPLLPRAFRSATLDTELDAAARAYLAQVTEVVGEKARTSELFFWYAEDWVKGSDPTKGPGRNETRKRLLEWLDPRHPAHRYLKAAPGPEFENRNDWDWAVNGASRSGF